MYPVCAKPQKAADEGHVDDQSKEFVAQKTAQREKTVREPEKEKPQQVNFGLSDYVNVLTPCGRYLA